MFDACILGLGYIGLPTAAVMADSGLNVLGVDINQSLVEAVSEGKVNIIEPGLETLVQKVVSEKKLKTSISVQPARVYVIAVPTPVNKDDLSPDLSYVMQAGRSISEHLTCGSLVILESTSPPGTTEDLVKLLAGERPDLNFPCEDCGQTDVYVSYCPERVLPGQVIKELKTNTRVVGGITSKCTSKAVNFYETFVAGDCIGVSSVKVAEMCKLVENSFRDVNIAFANELSVLCDQHKISSAELITVANQHPRVNILQPGPGVGGHCIAVDPWFLVHSNPQEARLIKTGREINDAKSEYTIDKITTFIQDYCNEFNRDGSIKIGIYGLSFKPNIDDLRESPAVKITQRLLELYDNQIFIVEPNIVELPNSFSGATLIDLNLAIEQVDLHIVLVAHDEFKNINYNPKFSYFAVNL